jgi:DNA replication initiation complex subunit (GINS family)
MNMTPEEKQLADAISNQIKAMQAFVAAVDALRANRKVIDLRVARMGTLTQQHLTNAGHTHLTPTKVVNMAAAMDALDSAFTSPMVSGDTSTTPLIRILDFLP